MYETKSEARNENSRDRAYGTCYCYGCRDVCVAEAAGACLFVSLTGRRDRNTEKCNDIILFLRP